MGDDKIMNRAAHTQFVINCMHAEKQQKHQSIGGDYGCCGAVRNAMPSHQQFTYYIECKFCDMDDYYDD